MADPNATVRIYDDEGNMIAEGQADEMVILLFQSRQKMLCP